MAVYWIAFLNVFPDQSGGYPGTNFGNQCGSETYKNPSGSSSPLLSYCPNIGPDIKTCQSMGKKVLLSLGGAIPNNQHVNSDTTAVNFANFLWRAFGPDKESSTSTFPRPFGNAVVDGFDFDIENVLASGENTGDLSRGYGTMITTLRTLYTSDKSKSYYISGAPQCVVPDTHLANAIETSWFDFLFVQFYNTPSCSARAYFDHSYGGTNTDISFDKWISFVKASSFNKNVKVYMGLPASNSDQVVYDPKMYLAPSEANSIIKAFQCKYPSNFGGVMVFEATYSEMNSINGKPYVDVLKGYLKGTGCATKAKKMIKREPIVVQSAVVGEPNFDTDLPTVALAGLAPSGLVSPPSATSNTASASGTASACDSSTTAYASAVCGTVGLFTGDSTPVGGSYDVASVEDCEALCSQNNLCESISYNADFGELCDQYGNTVTEGGFEANQYGVPFYDRGCFDTGSAPSSCSSTQSSSMSSSSSVPASSTASPQTTEEIVVTDIVTSYVTTCPYTHTATSSGQEIVETGMTTSTVFSTITSTICTKCVAPPTPAPTTEELTVTEIVTSYTTTCPFSHTTTSAGSVIVSTGTTVSTVFSTITSTIFPAGTGSPSSGNGSPTLPGALGHGASNAENVPSIPEAAEGSQASAGLSLAQSPAQGEQASAGSSPTGYSPSPSENEIPSQSGSAPAGSSLADSSPSSPESQSPAEAAQVPAGSSPAAAKTIQETILVVPVQTSTSVSVSISPLQTTLPITPGQSGQSGSQPPLPGQMGQSGSNAPFPAGNGTGSASPSGTSSPSQGTTATGPSVSAFTGAASRVGGGALGFVAFVAAAALML
ncbi:hypothetical protein P7C71_g4654, partial [Lecanoromycetidae sp. Uapishka_2]